MKGFNYTQMRKQSAEEKFKQQHEQEKAEAQDVVDSVLYADATMRERKADTASQPNENEAPVETVETSVETVEEPVDESVPETEEPKSETYNIKGSYRDSSGEDDFADDAEEDADVYEPPSEDDEEEASDYEEEPVYDEDLAEESERNTHLPDTDDSDELQRREEEAALRERTAAANNRNRARPKPAKQVANADIAMSTLKKFPTELAQYIKKLFPEARTMDEAVAAYVYMKEGEPDDIPVPKEIKQLVKGYIGEAVTLKDVQDEVLKELTRVREYNTRVMKKLNAVELAVGYDIFDRLGFRKANALTPSELNFLEAGMSDLIKQLEKQSEIKQNRDQQKSGRPIK